MVYLFAAQCAIAPKDIVFKLSCRREIADFSSIQYVFATKPRYRHAISVTRSIVESQGGRLWASDNSLRGASFYFTLPLKADAHMSDARS
jgi:hypothetical protein